MISIALDESSRTGCAAWRLRSVASLKALKPGCHPKQVITALAEDLLGHYLGKPLIDPYDIYQHLLDYWAEIMQDDLYLIAAVRGVDSLLHSRIQG